jgi:hypothetical protein
MNKRLSGKGYIRGGEGHFLTSTGDLYRYHEGVLTPEAAWPSPSPEPNQPTEPQGVIEMSDYLGTFELQPLYDSHQSFYGKAFVERWDTEHGMQLVLKSYGTVVAKVTPTYSDEDITTYAVEIGMGYLGATTLRHVKEFLAQADDTFHGVTLSWLRKAVRDGNPIDGVGSAWRKVYVLSEL